MQCLKKIKPQFLNWGFLFSILLLILSCSKVEEQDNTTGIEKNKPKEIIRQLKQIATTHALEKGYLLSWEKKNHNPLSKNPSLIQIDVTCDFTQNSSEYLECFILSTLEALPSKSLQYEFCQTISKINEDIRIKIDFCQAIYASPPILENSTIRQKAITFLNTDDPMQLASFQWNSTEWITFMAYLNGELSKDQLSILNNYFRFTETTDPHLLNAYTNLRTRD